MTEIKLEKRFPHIPDEDVTRIFQDGYMKGWENARKKAIPPNWIKRWFAENGFKFYDDNEDIHRVGDIEEMLFDWEKENETN